MFYHGSEKKWPKDQVWKVAFTLHFLEDRNQFLVLKGRLHNRKIGYGPVKNEQTGTDPCLFMFRGHGRLWPQNLKKHGVVPIPKNIMRIVYTSENVRSVLLS